MDSIGRPYENQSWGPSYKKQYDGHKDRYDEQKLRNDSEVLETKNLPVLETVTPVDDAGYVSNDVVEIQGDFGTGKFISSDPDIRITSYVEPGKWTPPNRTCEYLDKDGNKLTQPLCKDTI